MRYSIFLILLTSFLIQCQAPIQENALSEAEIYNKRAAEIVQLYLRNSDRCNCFLEPSYETYIENIAIDMPEMDTLIVKRELMERLEIESMTDLDAMLKLSKEFDVYKSFRNKEITILPRVGYDTISSLKGGNKWKESIDKVCPEGFCSVSKPIFNPSYNKVLLNIHTGGCIPSPPIKFTLQGDRWTNADLGWE